MLIKGTCEKQNLMQEIHKAILSPGSNWTEISSNKVNDYKHTGDMSDGWVFKSPPIGEKNQSIFLTLKSLDLSVIPTSVQGGNHLIMSLSDSYEPSNISGQNGIHINKSPNKAWCFCHVDTINCSAKSLFDYFIDIEDHRIVIIVQRVSETTLTYPQFLYIGYPEPSTNLEGDNYTNQFIVGSNLTGSSQGYGHWHRASDGTYFKHAKTSCSLNAMNPNPMGLYLLNPIFMDGDGISGLQNTGTLGMLSGIYGLSNTNIVNGDIVKIGDSSYKTFNLSQYSVGGHSNGIGIGSAYYYNSITPTIIAIKVD